MTTAAIEQMSWEGKLRTREELWEAITREGGPIFRWSALLPSTSA